MRLPFLISCCALVFGCASGPALVRPPAPAPVVVPFAEMMSTADRARGDGHVQKARDGYRAAATAYPAEHMPWVKLAQSHFEAVDYGNAIVAAEEALQRNREDQTALGILAASGLRVSSRAIASLSDKQSLGDSRTQAEGIVRNLRSLIGESVLAPDAESPVTWIRLPSEPSSPSGASPARSSPRPSTKPALPAPTVGASGVTASPPSAPASSAPVASTPSTNPLPVAVTAPRATADKKPTTTNPLEILR